MANISPKDFFSKGKVTVVGSDNENFVDTQDKGFLEKAWNGATNFGRNVAGAFKERTQQAKESIDRMKVKEQGLGSTFLQVEGAAAGFLNDVVGEGLKTGVKAVLPESAETKLKGAITTVMKNPTIVSSMEKYNEWKTANPVEAANVESALNIAALIPIGKGGQVVKEGVEAGIETGIKTTGKVIGKAGEVVEVAGRASKGTGEAIYKSAITPTVKEAEKQLAYRAKTPFLTRVKNALTGVADESKPITRATSALEKGIVGRATDIGVQAKRASQKIWKETIQQALDKTKEVITRDELFKPIIERINSVIEPSKKQALQDAFDAIVEDYKSVTQFTLKEAQKVKSTLDEFTPEKLFRGKSVANEYQVLKNDMANAIREKIYTTLKGEKIKKAYLDYANLKELEKIGVKAISEGGKYGGFGNFWTTLYDAATTPVKTISGQVLYRVGNRLEFVAEKGIKKFGDYLKSKGFQKP